MKSLQRTLEGSVAWEAGRTWRTSIGFDEAIPMKYFRPTSLNELRQVVREAIKEGVRVRGVGAGHSFSDISITNDYIVDMRNVKKPLSIPKDSFRLGVKNPQRYIEIEGGMTLKDLNEYLDKRGLALPTMPGIDVQTIAGAISTASHGTSNYIGSIADIVCSIVLVNGEGDVLKIEPKDGITDPTSYEHESIKLIQDDNMFYATLVGMGCMGIMYSVTLHTEKRFWLEERKYLSKWSQIRKEFESGELFGNNEHLDVLINPYEQNGDRLVSIVAQNSYTPKYKNEERERKQKWVVGASDQFPKLAASIFRNLCNIFPSQIPGVNSFILKKTTNGVFRSKSYKVYSQDLHDIKNEGYAAEYAFPTENCLEVMDLVFDKMEQLRQRGVYFTIPISIRFATASKAYMAMNAGYDVCMIDIHIIKGTKHEMIAMGEIEKMMLALGGRPHWGKYHHRLSGMTMLQKLYPMFKKWKQVYEQMNPWGVFNNKFTDRVGISVQTDKQLSREVEEQMVA